MSFNGHLLPAVSTLLPLLTVLAPRHQIQQSAGTSNATDIAAAELSLSLSLMQLHDKRGLNGLRHMPTGTQVTGTALSGLMSLLFIMVVINVPLLPVVQRRNTSWSAWHRSLRKFHTQWPGVLSVAPRKDRLLSGTRTIGVTLLLQAFVSISSQIFMISGLI